MKTNIPTNLEATDQLINSNTNLLNSYKRIFHSLWGVSLKNKFIVEVNEIYTIAITNDKPAMTSTNYPMQFDEEKANQLVKELILIDYQGNGIELKKVNCMNWYENKIKCMQSIVDELNTMKKGLMKNEYTKG